MLLLIAGEGEDRPRLETLISELDLSSSARLLGHRTDLRDWYEAMDVFALSSLREGLPNVLLEAMALEVPVVATRVAGVPRLIREGAEGLLVDPGAPEPLAEALGRVLGDAGLRASLARAARARVERDFSFAARMRKIQALYDRLLAARR